MKQKMKQNKNKNKNKNNLSILKTITRKITSMAG